jgi:hypothetical protein
MIDSVFGDVRFDAGWYTESTIRFDDVQHSIYVCANSYRDTDLITDEQRASYKAFLEHKQEVEDTIEKLLINYRNEKFLSLLKPTGFIFERDGVYALLFDDASDPDNGIAVLLSPEQKVVTQDDYL